MSEEEQRRESGYALQTLIITAVLVVIAAVVAVVIAAVNSGSRTNIESAGRSGTEAACASHEVFDPSWAAGGIGGSNSQGGMKSSRIGCRPHCATWEFVATPSAGGEYTLGGSGASPIGGPQGQGGVFSSKIGCFAPCYWHYDPPAGDAEAQTPEARHVKSSYSSLRFAADNRVPGVNEVRLGVVYWRTSNDNPDNRDTAAGATDIIRIRPEELLHATKESVIFRISTLARPGKPLPPLFVELGIPTVNRPNWVSEHVDPDPAPLPRFGTTWEDEDWEVRAAPEREVCEIVNTARNDELVCTSTRENCAAS